MFTGIVQAVGRVSELTRRDGDVELAVDTGALDLSACAVGDSIAVSGACLTMIRLEARCFAADVLSSRPLSQRWPVNKRSVGKVPVRLMIEP